MPLRMYTVSWPEQNYLIYFLKEFTGGALTIPELVNHNMQMIILEKKKERILSEIVVNFINFGVLCTFSHCQSNIPNELL